MTEPIKNIMSFDVEEYFHVEAAADRVDRNEWGKYPRRVHIGVNKILELLADTSTRATFFLLGLVAKENTGLIKKISSAGHEIASHGMTHHKITRLTPQQFREELDESKKMLEDITGQPVKGYRAPTFSLMHKTAWAIDELVAAGYEYDSSVYPVHHDRYGVPEAPRWSHIARSSAGGAEILEIPPLTMKLACANIPVGGGGYLRLLPTGVIISALKKANRNGLPGMIYLHPWELDPDQPELPLGKISRFRHRVNLGRTHKKLSRLFEKFSFTAAENLLDKLKSQATTTFEY